MSWLPLVGLYLLLMVGLFWCFRRCFTGRYQALLRTLLAGILLLMLGELIAEERGLWVIPGSTGLYFLEAPIEGALLVLATLLNSLIPYVVLERRQARRSGGKA